MSSFSLDYIRNPLGLGHDYENIETFTREIKTENRIQHIFADGVMNAVLLPPTNLVKTVIDFFVATPFLAFSRFTTTLKWEEFRAESHQILSEGYVHLLRGCFPAAAFSFQNNAEAIQGRGKGFFAVVLDDLWQWAGDLGAYSLSFDAQTEEWNRLKYANPFHFQGLQKVKRIAQMTWISIKCIARAIWFSIKWSGKQIGTRLNYVMLAVACTVVRAVDAILGIVAAGASFLTAGRYRSLNHIALRGLQFTGIVYDLSRCFHGILNPAVALAVT